MKVNAIHVISVIIRQQQNQILQNILSPFTKVNTIHVDSVVINQQQIPREKLQITRAWPRQIFTFFSFQYSDKPFQSNDKSIQSFELRIL